MGEKIQMPLNTAEIATGATAPTAKEIVLPTMVLTNTPKNITVAAASPIANNFHPSNMLETKLPAIIAAASK
jgi:hypothetical protein